MAMLIPALVCLDGVIEKNYHLQDFLSRLTTVRNVCIIIATQGTTRHSNVCTIATTNHLHQVGN